MKPVVMQLYWFFGWGMVGLLAHWLVKWLRGEIKVTLPTYLFLTNPRATALAMVGLIVAEATAFSLGAINDTSPLQTIIGLGFLAGYGADSALNKSV